MILTDDNFATIVTAVEGGRGIYDNLMKYVRVQLVMLGGFILTFVGAGVFDIAGGAPLTPLQILWINFADRRAAGDRARLRRRGARADAARAARRSCADRRSRARRSGSASRAWSWPRWRWASSPGARTGTTSSSRRRWD